MALPSHDTPTALILDSCPDKTAYRSPLSVSHTYALASSHPATNILPDLEKATEVIGDIMSGEA